MTIQYGLTTIQASSFQSTGVNATTCRYYNSNAMYIFDVAVLTVPKQEYKNFVTNFFFQLSEPIPEELFEPVVLEDRPCSTTHQLDAQIIGWGRNEVYNLLINLELNYSRC